MPFIEHSTYQAKPWQSYRHFQTIFPSFFRKEKKVNYQREKFYTPNQDYFYLDWSFYNPKHHSDELVIVSHGLCGNTNRHYVLGIIRTFNRHGIDGMAWNYHGNGSCENGTPSVTTSNSSQELSWIVQHAIKRGHYKKVYLVGFSMGGNLTTLYLGRHNDIPPQVAGGVCFCATIDLIANSKLLKNPMGRVYTIHFLSLLKKVIRQKHQQFPNLVSTYGLNDIHTILQFDNRYTAPMNGFRDIYEYWETASAYHWLNNLDVPLLIVNPANDPFTTGQCYPIETAKKSSKLFLEIPESGGHCGFITPENQVWWPAQRAYEFISQL
ncbi:MAG: alpha/beta fold hydrolase [Lentisphaeria bacterium]